jgi:hypothetical protein
LHRRCGALANSHGSQTYGFNLENDMKLPTRTLAAALIAAAIPAYAGSAAAAPLSQSLSLNSADVGNVEQVQYRRHGGHWHGGRWIGPAAAGFAAGAIIGGALSAQHYNDGYYAYGAAPYAEEPYADGYYAYGAAAPGYAEPRTRWGYGAQAPSPGSSPRCTGDREQNSAFPSWMCR